jgi:membrane-bound metal-dependent hydrolase YbcI (DUF457 family)
MATPLGHYIVGLAMAEAVRRHPHERSWAPWLAAVACIPDLDFLPGFLVGEPSRFHHGVSHSLTAAALFATVLALLRIGRGRPLQGRVLLLVFAIYTSHNVLDYFTLDSGPPHGVPLFWPWSEQTFQAPWPLLPNVQHTVKPALSVHNALLGLREVLIFAPLVGVAIAVRTSVAPWRKPAVWLCGVWFLMAAGMSMVSLG